MSVSELGLSTLSIGFMLSDPIFTFYLLLPQPFKMLSVDAALKEFLWEKDKIGKKNTDRASIENEN